MASVLEIMQLCRLCLEKDEVNTPIFEGQGDIRQIFLKISACLPVKVSKEDKLPKNICDGCSCKLEMLYQFWNTSANAEKKLIRWLDQIGTDKLSDKEEAAVPLQSQHSISSVPVVLKQEVDDVVDSQSTGDDIVPDDLNVSNDSQEYLLQQEQLPYQPVEFQFQQDGFDPETADDDISQNVESDPLPKQRKRRAAAMKTLPTMDSEDEDDPDLINTKIAKTEEQSEESGGEDMTEPTTFVGVPSADDDEQPGPSGVGKTSGDAPTGSVIGRNQCDVCFKTFFKPSRLRSHKVIHADEKPFTCDLCSASFKRNNALYTHMKKVHQMIYSCEECKIVVSSNLALKIHMNFHTKKFVYECLLCENPFYTKDDAVKHLLDAHEKDEFEPNVAYKCNVCGKYLASGRTLTEHMKEVHPDEYRCKHCNEIFSSNKFLKEHMKSHSNTENGAKKQPGRLNQTKLYKCKFCRKNLDSICTLADHQKTFHPNEVDHSKHECGVCGKLLANKSSLHTHKQSHGDKLICHICGKPLASKLGLTEHLRLHDNVKPYQCEVCGRRFTKLSNLGPHRRTHYQAKIHKCTLCEKAFSQKCTLVIHMRHHSGEKPFKCGLCDSAFISSSLLRNHSKVKHCLF